MSGKNDKAGKGKKVDEELDLLDNEDGTFTNEKTGEIVDENGKPIPVDEAMFGSADDVTRAAGDGGFTIKKVKLMTGRSITGKFMGFAPYEYLDKRGDKPKLVVLSDVVIDVVNPKTGKPMGLIIKLGASTRILQDMVMASPGDTVKIARLGTTKAPNGNNMHDDVTRIYPANPGTGAVMALSAKAVTDHQQLGAFRAGVGKALPPASTTRTDTDDLRDGITPAPALTDGTPAQA